MKIPSFDYQNFPSKLQLGDLSEQLDFSKTKMCSFIGRVVFVF